MFQAGILSASCLSLLVTIDVIIAAYFKTRGCPRCGGPLHAAPYWRKPRGHVEPLDPQTTLRLSWCCGRDGCRHRVTPPSVRFLGRLVYTGPTVLALQSTPPNSPAEAQLRAEAGCSRPSIRRWRDRFARLWETAIGRTIAGAMTLGLSERRQPRSVLSLWTGRWPYLATMWQMLIHPQTGGRGWETDGLSRGPLDAQKMGFAQHLADLHTAACAL